MSTGTSGQLQKAQQITNQAQGQAQNDQSQQAQLTGAAQNTLGQFEGPVQQSPFYKSLLNTGIQNTSQAYNQADTNLRRAAQQGGFGNNQPVTQGAEAQLGAQEAAAQANLPQEAMLQASGPALQAAGQSGNMGTAYGNQGLGYTNTELGANQQAANIAQQQAAQRQAMWQALAQTAAMAAA